MGEATEKVLEAPSSPAEGFRNFEQPWIWEGASLLWDGEVSISQNLYIFQLDGVSSEHPEQVEVGEGMVGSRRSPCSPHMVVEARLVSSCLSLPSRARPRFWRFAESRGVTEYVLEKVELAATVSLEGWERRAQSQPQPGGA